MMMRIRRFFGMKYGVPMTTRMERQEAGLDNLEKRVTELSDTVYGQPYSWSLFPMYERRPALPSLTERIAKLEKLVLPTCSGCGRTKGEEDSCYKE